MIINIIKNIIYLRFRRLKQSIVLRIIENSLKTEPYFDILPLKHRQD